MAFTLLSKSKLSKGVFNYLRYLDFKDVIP